MSLSLISVDSSTEKEGLEASAMRSVRDMNLEREAVSIGVGQGGAEKEDGPEIRVIAVRFVEQGLDVEVDHGYRVDGAPFHLDSLQFHPMPETTLPPLELFISSSLQQSIGAVSESDVEYIARLIEEDVCSRALVLPFDVQVLKSMHVPCRSLHH